MVKSQDSDQVLCNQAWRIVVLGSSSAYGAGASIEDSSWVAKFKAYVKRKNINSQVSNYGIPGFRTYQNLRPNGYVPPPNRPLPSTAFNISAALAMQPDAIIVNMPSNDASSNYTLAEQQANFEGMMYLADSANVPVWVTTTQPRNNFTTGQISNLTSMRDWIIERFGNKSVNFWDGVANADGSINSVYFFDNAHVNDLGHELFFRRLQQESILDSLCKRYLGNLIVDAGADQQLGAATSVAGLQGIANNTKAVVTSTNWRFLSGPNTPSILDSTQLSTQVVGLIPGTYQFELRAWDIKGNFATDTIRITIGCSMSTTINQVICYSQLPFTWNGIRCQQPGTYVKSFLTSAGCDSLVQLNLTLASCGTTGLSIRVKMEQYIQPDGRMGPYLFEQGMSPDSMIVDTVHLSLWKPENLNNPSPDFQQTLPVDRDGYAYGAFSPTNGLLVYISIRHRNSLQVWSKFPILLDSINHFSFCQANAVHQDGDQPVQILLDNDEYALFSGDINQDGTIDLFDLQLIENGASNFLYGYHAEDCTGDGVVDLSDMQLVENRNNAFLFSSKP
jgi:lysophospholipase L1-like esterase